MKIASNYPIGENSINEFVRIILPEIFEKDLSIEFKSLEGKIITTLNIEGVEKEFSFPDIEHKLDDEKIIITKTSLMRFYGKSLPWGGLIGVRPTKVVKRLRNLGFTFQEIESFLENIYLVSREKAQILIDIFQKEQKLMNNEATSIYIGIPFCPTKCRYCSFASFEIGGPVGERYYKGFVETLLKEIVLTGNLVKEKNMRIESIYIGGGTPSTLTERDLEAVLNAVCENIPMENLKEFTFEAGREDSITFEKLKIAKKYGVDRVSLNPQTFDQQTLERINRNFNKENFDKCYSQMKQLGFIINMDLILGLPGEKEEEILNTLDIIEGYDIENLTIHSLALKKASVLFKDEEKEVNSHSREKVEKRVKTLLEKKNMEPYYIYRQKNSADWGENVGYATPGYESLFNMEMIEENQDTIGIGGGAITKKINSTDGNREDITRVINPKEPATYIREMGERFNEKIKLFS